jgi:hypothetical protein
MSAPVTGVASPVQTVVRTADPDGEPILRQPQEVYAPRAWSLSVRTSSCASSSERFMSSSSWILRPYPRPWWSGCTANSRKR